MFTRNLYAVLLVTIFAAVPSFAQENAGTAALAAEVHAKGWIVYGARSDGGGWDLFLTRPDGSSRQAITHTPEYEEAAPRFSPDGTRLLYRRLAGGTRIDHDKWGFQGELVVAEGDGSNPRVLGGEGEFPWASWSPDGTQVVCLTKKGIQVVDLDTKQVVREFPRQGIYQQLFWSPDGKWFCGVANHLGESWTVVRLSAETGAMNPVRSFQNCTPDWCPDSKTLIFSSRPGDQGGYGYTQLWMAEGDGSNQRLVYGEDGAHVYGGATSPDGAYLLFTKGPKDGSGAEGSGAPMGIMRAADAPIITGESAALRALHPDTKDGAVLLLDMGWEPHWTYAEVGKDEG